MRKLNLIDRCRMVTYPKKSNALISEMYHYLCAVEFPQGTVAMRRMLCSCKTCDTINKLPWDSNITDIKDQLGFQRNNNC